MIEAFYCRVEAIYFYNHCMFSHFFEQIDIQGELNIQYVLKMILSIGPSFGLVHFSQKR